VPTVRLAKETRLKSGQRLASDPVLKRRIPIAAAIEWFCQPQDCGHRKWARSAHLELNGAGSGAEPQVPHGISEMLLIRAGSASDLT
jgi:hypothetical protein